MNFLNALSCVLWGAYHWNGGRFNLAYSNFLGDICTLALVPACISAEGYLSLHNPLVMLSEIFVSVTYRLPKRLLPFQSFDEETLDEVSFDRDSLTGSASDVMGKHFGARSKNFKEVDAFARYCEVTKVRVSPDSRKHQ
jgi:hypothetical protein